MKGRDRNALCWCGSGKKFKKCHSDRENQALENPWAAMEVNKQAFTKKKCWACDVGLGPCDGDVIKSHTVSRGANLTKIAKDGHVLQYTASIPEMKKNGGKLLIKKIGIGVASVFNGFCAKHDREIFSCIENQQFTGLPIQCLVVAYRTMSRELYGKDASAHLRETLREADRGLKPFEQVVLQRMLDEVDKGNEAARRELKMTHNRLTNALVGKQLDVIRSLVIEFSTPLPFMCAGAWSPFTDLNGNKLQIGYTDELLEQVFISSFAGDPCAMICISWRDIEGAPGKVIAEQMKALPLNQQATACLQLVMKHVENIFFNPDWFKNLNDERRERLNQLAADGVDMMGSVPSVPIRFDVDFPLPIALRSFQV